VETKLKQWVKGVAQTDRTLAAILRGLVGAHTEDGLTTFIWHSTFHRDTAIRKEVDIRTHLGPWADNEISHVLVSELAEEDPMIEVALELGAKITFIN
jgi:hypothetical protein